MLSFVKLSLLRFARFHARRGGGVAISARKPRRKLSRPGRSAELGWIANPSLIAGSSAGAMHPATQQGLALWLSDFAGAGISLQWSALAMLSWWPAWAALASPIGIANGAKARATAIIMEKRRRTLTGGPMAGKRFIGNGMGLLSPRDWLFPVNTSTMFATRRPL